MYALIGKYVAVAGLVVTGVHYGANGIVDGERLAGEWASERGNVVAEAVAEELGFERPRLPEVVLSRAEVIEVESRKAGVNPGLVRSLIAVESKGKALAISSKGAIGLMQVMPENAAFCGLSSASMLLDEVNNIRCGVKMLASELKATGGDLVKALRNYNAGPNKCQKGECEETENHWRLVLKNWAKDSV